MLDWVDIEEQKPVLADEPTPSRTSTRIWKSGATDTTSPAPARDHLALNELPAKSVAEGQATAVMMDYILKPMGKSLVKDPEVMDVVKQQITTSRGGLARSRAHR